jgi:SAM-dependent methyltransferase
MNTPLRFLKAIYNRTVPGPIRNSGFAERIKLRLIGHDAVYSRDYYERTIEGPAVTSAGGIARSIIEDFGRPAVIDVGCGTGALLAALRDEGCPVFGLEYSDAGLAFCRGRGLSVLKFNLVNDRFREDRRFDLAVSFEVAEHLPARVADRFVDLLVRLAPAVAITAAKPGQTGVGHLNEQPPAYWIEKFRKRGLEHDGETSRRWSRQWEDCGTVRNWYYQNLLVFRKVAPREAE